jgi:selenocysteine-specific elongation factor
VVDVPGHERFIRAMVAGATGLDLVLLVVAADEGIMPQTREHLDVCQLLGVRRGVVAVTKARSGRPRVAGAPRRRAGRLPGRDLPGRRAAPAGVGEAPGLGCRRWSRRSRAA